MNIESSKQPYSDNLQHRGSWFVLNFILGVTVWMGGFLLVMGFGFVFITGGPIHVYRIQSDWGWFFYGMGVLFLAWSVPDFALQLYRAFREQITLYREKKAAKRGMML